ncbi:MAG: HAD family hydrolase [Planctomycetota bacterium]|jgi:hypothetical protein|nr:HAD family hydrolase [Planctomycetota bacterium]
MPAALRIAMWSGPRNVSTALLRSFGSRHDTVVFDEPLYAHWLRETGSPHPGAEEIQRLHETDWRLVAQQLTGPLPDGKKVCYQKHMAHHLLPSIDRTWLDQMTHVFLIREPRAMLASLCRVLPRPGLFDTGLPQQVELFDHILSTTGTAPPVIDSEDLLRDPESVLRALCTRLELEFDTSMLAWKAGPRDTDGCWSPYWYETVLKSTGFQPYSQSTPSLPSSLEPMLEACEELYRTLHTHRLVMQES